MKIKIIIIVFCLSIIALISCQKENNNTKPVAEASDAVKDYFGLRKGADIGVENAGIPGGTKKNQLHKRKSLKTIHPAGGAECVVNEDRENGFYGSFLPCAMVEGYYEGSWDTSNDRFTMRLNWCSIDPEKPIECYDFFIENAILNGSVYYGKTRHVETIEGEPAFEYIVDHLYEYSSDEYQFIVKFNGEVIQENSSRVRSKYLNGSMSLSKGEVTYSSTYLEEIVLKVRERIIIDDDAIHYVDNEEVVGTIEMNIPEETKVKGIEKVQYEREGVSGEFTIDYGNGELDTKAVITENGISYEIDYIEMEEARWEELKN